ncbi:MAG: hypothetical protein ACM3JI_03200 [Anaerolineae bacterium]
MSSSTISTYQLQTRVWDKPQIISFDSLLTKYSVESIFKNEEIKQMHSVLAKWKDLASNHFSIKKSRDRPPIATYVCSNPTITRRTAHVELEETPHIIYKTYYPNSSSLHPMAWIRRLHMGKLANA